MKRTPLKPMSKKRQKLMIERRHFTKDLLHARPHCEARLAGCTTQAVDVHERLNRSQGGKIVGGGSTDYMALCRTCHTFITDNPSMAYDLGFSIHRWDV